MTEPFQSGRFITLEGGEGAGKSTQIKLLAEWLGRQGLTVDVTREPGGSPGAEEIRALLVTGATGRWEPLTETLLHYAARRDHTTTRIGPALKSGRWVVSDRFFDSTMAYQGYGQGVSAEFIQRLRRLTIGDLQPDLTIVLDVPPETRLSRTSNRPGREDRYERMNEAFHARVRAGFQTIAASEPGRCVLIDGGSSVEFVAASIQAAILTKLISPSAKP